MRRTTSVSQRNGWNGRRICTLANLGHPDGRGKAKAVKVGVFRRDLRSCENRRTAGIDSSVMRMHWRPWCCDKFGIGGTTGRRRTLNQVASIEMPNGIMHLMPDVAFGAVDWARTSGIWARRLRHSVRQGCLITAVIQVELYGKPPRT